MTNYIKTTILLFISFYRNIVSPFLKNVLGVRSFCRLSPTCSEYSFNKIKKYGLIKGGKMSIHRILQCQPFFSAKKKSFLGGSF